MEVNKEIEILKNQIKHLSMDFESQKEHLFECDDCRKLFEESKKIILEKNEKIRNQYDLGKQANKASAIKLSDSDYQKMKEQDQDAIHGFSFEPCSPEHLSIQREMAKAYRRMEANKKQLIELNRKVASS